MFARLPSSIRSSAISTSIICFTSLLLLGFGKVA